MNSTSRQLRQLRQNAVNLPIPASLFDGGIEPSQWARLYGGLGITRGPARLFAEILRDAMACIRQPHDGGHSRLSGRQAMVRAETAVVWVLDDKKWKVSFRYCCDVLGLEAKRVRTKLMEGVSWHQEEVWLMEYFCKADVLTGKKSINRMEYHGAGERLSVRAILKPLLPENAQIVHLWQSRMSFPASWGATIIE